MRPIEIFEQLVSYMSQANRALWLEDAEAAYGPIVVGTIAARLLGWLRSGRHKPLTLDSAYPWCAALENWLQSAGPLSEILAVRGGRCDFVEGVSDADIAAIRAMVGAKHNPRPYP